MKYYQTCMVRGGCRPGAQKLFKAERTLIMVRLDCNVMHCVHNADNCCCRGNILVDGTHATDKKSTNCSSFSMRNQHGSKNALETPDTYIGVDCYAINCKYNQSKVCHADHIRISGSNAVTVPETECASFEAR